MSMYGRFMMIAALVMSTWQPVQARGVLLDPSDLDPADRESLSAAIAEARGSDPESFRLLADLRSRVAAIDAARRGRLPVFLPALQALGPGGLLPMLDELAFSAAPRGELADTAWLGWRASLLEAVGKLRDPRAVPVLRAAVSRGPAERLLVAAAAGALGKLLTEDEARWLVARLPAVTGEARLGLLQGLGHCRRGVAAEALAAALTAAPGDEEARVLARALGTVGSSWAWRTPVVAASGEEDAVRGTAARALAGAWMLYRGQAQKTIGHALLVVAHTDTAALLRMAVTDGDEDTRSAAEELIRRFEDRSFRGEP